MSDSVSVITNDLSVEGFDDGTLLIVSECEPDAVAELAYYGEACESKQRALAWLFAASPALLDLARAVVTAYGDERFRHQTEDHLYKGALAAIERATPPEASS